MGVYRGFFARCINQLLPNRKLYLFDSFDRFAENACASESFQAAHKILPSIRFWKSCPIPKKSP